jgi:hypothetical protein
MRAAFRADMWKVICAVVALALFVLPLSRVSAEDQKESVQATIEKRLQAFDPVAVAAARHYYESPALKSLLQAMLQQYTQIMETAARRANPGLDEATQREVSEAAHEVLNSRLDLIVEMSMVAVLEVLSTEEIVAVDKFYSSPVGVSVMTKLPQAMKRLPTMMQVLLPLITEDMRAKMKAKGKDLKL